MSRRPEFLRERERMRITLDHLLDNFLAAKEVKSCSPKTLVAYRGDLSRLLRFLRDQGHSFKLSDLTIEDARAFVSSIQGEVTKWAKHPFLRPRGGSRYSPHTVHQHVRVLRTFSDWMYREGYTPYPVLERLDLPKLPLTKVEVLSEDEIRRILSVINPETFLGPRLYAMVLLFLDTGLRVSELVGLSMSDVDWTRGVLKVMGKGAKAYSSASAVRFGEEPGLGLSTRKRTGKRAAYFHSGPSSLRPRMLPWNYAARIIRLILPLLSGEGIRIATFFSKTALPMEGSTVLPLASALQNLHRSLSSQLGPFEVGVKIQNRKIVLFRANVLVGIVKVQLKPAGCSCNSRHIVESEPHKPDTTGNQQIVDATQKSLVHSSLDQNDAKRIERKLTEVEGFPGCGSQESLHGASLILI